MTEIKFRGKRIDNNEWVYGYLCGKCLISCLRNGIINYGSNADFTCYAVKVIEKTVGQFTGILDKNDNPIYEGDIVKNGMSGDWIIQPLEEGAMSLLGLSAQYKGSNYDISALNENVEVIGNIHDKI